MGIRDIAYKIKKHLDEPKFVLPWLIAGSVAVGTPTIDYLYEDTNNEPTAQTAQITNEFNQRVNGFTDRLDRYDAIEKFGSIAKETEDVKVTVDGSLIDDYLSLKKTLRHDANDLFSDIMLNSDLSEEGAENLILKMRNKGLNDFVEGGMPQGGFYALDEIKASFNGEGLSALDKAQALSQKIKQEEKEDVGLTFATVLGTPVGVFTGMWLLWLGAGRISENQPTPRKRSSKPLRN